jgi:rRNA maturation endonuclease Nob1
MHRCATCRRELKDESQVFCNECGRGYGKKPGEGTRATPGRTAARRRRRRGR